MTNQTEICPFCHTSIPTGAVVCSGCHAFKATNARAKRLSGLVAFAWLAWLVVSGLTLNGLIHDFNLHDLGGFLGVLIVGGGVLALVSKWALQVRWWRRM